MKTGDLWQDFEWYRATEGYKWLDVGGRALLVPKQERGALRTVAYHPMTKDYAGLFNQLAELKAEPEAVLDFANQYGQLGWPLKTWAEPDWNWDEDEYPGRDREGEPDWVLFKADEPNLAWTSPANPQTNVVGELLGQASIPEWKHADSSTWAAQIGLLSWV